MFSKREKYYFDRDAILVPARYDGRKETMNKGSLKYSNHVALTNHPQSMAMAERPHERWRFVGGKAVKQKRDVWKVSTVPYRGEHFAPFPPNLILPCVLASTRPGGTVLDPFIGSGTTALVAEQNNRRWIGIDIQPKCEQLLNERMCKSMKKPFEPSKKRKKNQNVTGDHLLCARCAELFRENGYSVTQGSLVEKENCDRCGQRGVYITNVSK